MTELTHILVDFENLQPKDFELLDGDRCRVVLFLGPHQNKLALDVVQSLQRLGRSVAYVQSEKKARNALDFHIAFYLGRVLHEPLATGTSRSKRDRFVVVTKDGGFDGLLSHIRSLGYDATKAVTIGEALGERPGNTSGKRAPSKTDAVSKVIANLRKHPKNRPSTRAALERHITTAFGGMATPSAVEDVIDAMGRAGVIKITDKNVEYSLPSD
jgi:hypothetical protein